MDVVKLRRYAGLVVGASSEMNVDVAWSDEERNEEQVEHQAYPSIEKRKPDSKQGDHGPIIVRLLAKLTMCESISFSTRRTGWRRTTIRHIAPVLSLPDFNRKRELLWARTGKSPAKM